MRAKFWHNRWADRKIGFHEGKPNGLLVACFDALGLAPGSRIFLPFCGKTRDIHWLLGKGLRVAGAELSGVAVGELFAELNLVPNITKIGSLEKHSAPNIDIFVGDMLALTADMLGPVDAVYDRAALVALPVLPDDMRTPYARHLAAITGTAPQLLVTFDYDQNQLAGPPFAVRVAEVERLYQPAYTVAQLAARPLTVRGIPATECAWHLAPKNL